MTGSYDCGQVLVLLVSRPSQSGLRRSRGRSVVSAVGSETLCVVDVLGVFACPEQALHHHPSSKCTYITQIIIIIIIITCVFVLVGGL